MSIYARPHRNGNLPETFEREARDLMAAIQPLKEALVQIRCSSCHGRNYQHISNATDAAISREFDQKKIDHLLEAAIIAEQLAIDINLAAQGTHT